MVSGYFRERDLGKEPKFMAGKSHNARPLLWWYGLLEMDQRAIGVK
jgi:hypothetical protein